MDYQRLLSGSLPIPVEMPPGLGADTKYVFSVTNADPHSVPFDGLSDALKTAMSREGPDLAKYPPGQGHEGMREMIASNLKARRGIEAGPDDVFLSAGAGGAIQSIIDVLVEPGDPVLVEEFTYQGTLRMLLERGAAVVHVPTDQDGMDTEALEGAVKRLISQGRRPKMIYTISVYQNPMGMNLGLERRERMVEVSQRYGVPIVENESYADFRIDGAPLPPAMMGLDDQESVIYVSAYTKLLGCGLRLGYGVVPAPVLEALKKIRLGTSPSHLSSMAVHEYLSRHGDDYVEALRLSLRDKRDAMLSALGESFPSGCSWNTPGGGMMVWVQLPEGADTWAALDPAVEAGVKYNPGPLFRAQRDRSNYLRLTYSHNSPEEIREGVSILADVFQREGLFNDA